MCVMLTFKCSANKRQREKRKKEPASQVFQEEILRYFGDSFTKEKEDSKGRHRVTKKEKDRDRERERERPVVAQIVSQVDTSCSVSMVTVIK